MGTWVWQATDVYHVDTVISRYCGALVPGSSGDLCCYVLAQSLMTELHMRVGGFFSLTTAEWC
jgi:hypothetical protein